MRTAPIVALLALGPALQARPVGYRSYASLNTVPAWAVCTVEQVIKLGEVPAHERRSPWAERNYRARVLVHRAFFRAATRRFQPGSRVTIYYANPEPPLPHAGGGSSGPPIILDLQKGQTALLPLSPRGGLWTVQFDQSWNPEVVALPGEPGLAGPPRTGGAFVFRELAHVLASGDARKRSQAAAYLGTFAGDIPNELPRLLARAFGSDDNVWLEAGCAFLGNFGVPRNNAELVYGEASPPFHGLRPLVTWILWKGDRRDYPNRLIRCLLRNSSVYAWGAAATLVDFKDSTVLIDGLNAALRRNRRGSLTVAYSVVKAGQRAVLPEALEAAQRLIIRTEAQFSELRPPAQLILDYGEDRHFEALVAALTRFKQDNEDRYRALWGAAGYGSGQNGRVLRLAAVLIDDRRFGFGALRYCDVAAGVVQSISGVQAGVSQQMSIEERDRAVARASAWLKARRSGTR